MIYKVSFEERPPSWLEKVDFPGFLGSHSGNQNITYWLILWTTIVHHTLIIFKSS